MLYVLCVIFVPDIAEFPKFQKQGSHFFVLIFLKMNTKTVKQSYIS